MAKAEALLSELLAPGTASAEWDAFVERSPQGTIFCRSWWLDAVCPEQYQILVLRRGGEIAAGIPLPTYVMHGRKVLFRPQLTQMLGPLLTPPTSERHEKQLSTEMGLLEALIEAMPDFTAQSIACSPALTNWLPFYWTGYRQTTLYSYILPDLTDPEMVMKGFAHSKRKNIKKAVKTVTVDTGIGVRALYDHQSAMLALKGDAPTYSFELLRRIFDATLARDSSRTWFATDDDGNMHAAIFVVFDKRSAHYLVSSIDPEFSSVGAVSLLLHDAISWLAERTEAFNFEGSMIKPVEHSFRKFGARQTPFFVLRKGNPLVASYFDARRRRIGPGDVLRRLRRGPR